MSLAEKQAKDAVAYAEHFGAADFRLAISLNDLAQIYLERQKTENAKSLLERAGSVLDNAEKEAKTPLVEEIVWQEKASVLRSMGDIELAADHFEKAQSYYLQAKQILSRWCKQCSTDRGNPLGSDFVEITRRLAFSQMKLGRRQEAEDNLKTALSLAENNDFESQNEIRADLQNIYRLNGKKDEAKALDAGRTWSELALKARRHYNARAYGEARAIYLQALSEARKLSENDRRLAITYKGLADCEHHLGNGAAQESFEIAALKICRAMPNPIYGLTDDLLSDLARLRKLSGRYQESLEVLLEQLRLRETRYASRLAETCSELAFMEWRLGNAKEARDYAERSLQLFRKDPVSKRAQAAALLQLSETFASLHDYDNAIQALKASIVITGEKLHLKDARTPLALYRLANLYSLNREPALAQNSSAAALKYLSGLAPKRYLDTAFGLEELMAVSNDDKQAARARYADWILDLCSAFYDLPEADGQFLPEMKKIESRARKTLKDIKNLHSKVE